jgi:hypothetical protein
VRNVSSWQIHEKAGCRDGYAGERPKDNGCKNVNKRGNRPLQARMQADAFALYAKSKHRQNGDRHDVVDSVARDY